MEKSSKLGLKNRTGLQMSPQHAREMLAHLEAEGLPPTQWDRSLAAARSAYISEAEPLGSVPAPASRPWGRTRRRKRRAQT